MRIRYRLMLAAAVALTVCLVAVVLWPEPSLPAAPSTVAVIPSGAPPEPAPAVVPARAAAPVEVRPVAASLPPEAPAATVVALGPGDVAPEPEVDNPPPQQNDPVEPELPQTPRWRLEKTAHITALLGRDVERMEREREEAESRGDDARSEELGRLIRRNRERLHELREEMRELSNAVQEESPEE